MIQLFVSSSNASNRKARRWLQENHLPYQERNIFSKPLSKAELKKLLCRTENGTEDIIATHSNAYQALTCNLEDLSLDKLLDLLVQEPHLLKRPIIFDDKRLEVGFNEEEVRRFLPREVRMLEFQEAERLIDR
ncbi:regulatory protein Spx [Lactobacillus selangorensis]|uniref:Regulatory protein Spx n=1 Tax=Lactobacillus selangorensis TaxID=81857 RepID=A0A0R2FS80_9LACO|nr:transcriptional regulator Spx [Lactobacillus selangorensis]KRN27978.1 regulatory protein Spx [Lactobacillus selangorensis]